ncbi:MAG: type II toxin-antitoxin system RatA family toxin [Gammaproteobacteria bacterium]|nr:type II toxin-antitoxin system RatA family toxin [Gammaproteobacteria bacterium]
MKKVSRSALVPYSCEQMFDMANDAIRYPEFLPWCAAAEIFSETESEMVARLELTKGGLHKSFTTRSKKYRPDSIDIQLEDGPFHELTGKWTFKALGTEGCKVTLELAFEFSGGLIDSALLHFCSQGADRIMDAFCERADRLYA